jgi:hypothetical protein
LRALSSINSPLWKLAGLGLASELLYLFVFALSFPLARYYDIKPPVDYAKLTGRAPGSALAYVLAITTLFVAYGAALYLAKGILGPGKAVLAKAPGSPGPISPALTPDRQRDQPPAPQLYTLLAIILGFTVLFCITLATMYPILAIDLFCYAMRSRVFVIHGANPLAIPPSTFSTDPWLPLMGEWADVPSPYGPLWEGLAALPVLLFRENYLLHLFGLKVLAILSYLVGLGFIYAILGYVAPEERLWGTLYYAWNPLLLLETAGNGHNDLLMMAFALLAFYLLVTGRRWWVFPALTASILVKFTTVLFVPPFLLFMGRQIPGWRRRIIFSGFALACMAGLIGLIFGPVWPSWDAWEIRSMGDSATRSPMALLVLLLRMQMVDQVAAFYIAQYFMLGLFLLLYLWLLRRPFQRFTGLVEVSFAIVFAYLVVGSQQFHAWYLVWLVPLAALLCQPMTVIVAGVFCWSALIVVPWYEMLHVRYLDTWSLIGVYMVGVPLAFGPPLLAWVWWRWRRRGLGQS